MGLGFGLSFGKKKSSTNQTSTLVKDEATNQQQSGTTASSGVTNSSSSGQSSGFTTGQQTTSQSGTTKSTGTQTGTSQQTTSAFSDSTLSAIERAVGDLFGKVGSAAPISAFDKESFIADTMAATSNDVNSGLEANVNQLITNLGGTADSNSMGALLTNRMRSDAAAQLAGVQATTTAQAEEIARQNALAMSTVAGQDQGFLGQLLAALKGGVVTTTGTESVQTAQEQQNQSSGTTNTAEQTSQQQSQQATQTQQLLEMMNQLLSGNTHTTGTETMKGTTKSGGFGISASI